MKKLMAFMLALALSANAWPAALFGTVDALSGTADLSDPSGGQTAVFVGQQVYAGQTVDSGPDGEVHIVTVDGGIIAIRPGTEFRIDQYQAEGDSTDKIFMSLFKGAVRSITGWIGKHNPAAYLITTPTATIGIRGTDHETAVIGQGGGDEPGTYDTVNEGETVLKTPQGEAEVTPGKFAFAPRGRAIAPYFLQRRPRFMALRKLRIEQRIQRRKEYLRGRLEQMRNTRIKRLKARREKQPGQKRSRGPAEQQRRELRRQQAQQRRAERLSKFRDRERRGRMMQNGSAD